MTGPTTSPAPSAAAILPHAGAPPTREELCAAFEALGGNIARVAKHYGKARRQIYRWARRYQIDLGAYRAPGRSQGIP